MSKIKTILAVMFGAVMIFATPMLSACDHFNDSSNDSTFGESSSGQEEVIEGVHKVTFETNGGSMVLAQEVDHKARLNKVEDPTKSGYIFGGWYTDENLTEKFNVLVKRITEDMTLYAKWTSVDFTGYTVTFNTDGGTNIENQTIEEDGYVTKPEDPEKKGFFFDNWYIDELCTTVYNFSRDKVTSNITIYAKWLKAVTVTFETNGGSAIASQTIVEGQKVNKPDAPKKENIVFDRWYADAACTVEFDFNSAITQDVTIYAGWLKNYNVVFDTDGGSEVETQVLSEGSFATKPESDPTKEGFTFGGWYADESCTVIFDFEKTEITKDTYVYAKWLDENMIVITFDWNFEGGEVIVKEIEKGSRTTAPADINRGANFVFDGWFTVDGVEFKKATKHQGNTTFYAKWRGTYRFEAEDTQLTGLDPEKDPTCTAEGLKCGNNFSGEKNGLSLIDTGASGNKYINGLVYKGAYLDFELQSSADVEGVTLKISVAAWYCNITLNDTKFKVLVNGEACKFDEISLVSPGKDQTGNFSTITCLDVKLKKGDNLIKLLVNNSEQPAGEAGTIEASAPCIDYIELICDSELTMTKYDNSGAKSVSEVDVLAVRKKEEL